MGWFTKKDNRTSAEKMPELPELPNSPHTDLILPLSPDSPSTPPTLSFPDENKIAPPPQILPEKATKDLSNSNYKPQINELKPGMQKSRFGQPEFSSPSPPYPTANYTVPKFKEPSYAPSTHPIQALAPSVMPQIKSFPKKDESVFIKLDKFQNTIEAFRDINEKIKEIEELLVKTKEIKLREEKELEDWEREIEAIKLKLETIGREISGLEA